MAITTYAELKGAISNWLNRGDLTSIIPDFITLAEADINRTLRVSSQMKRSTATLDGQFSDLPTDFGQMDHVQLNDTVPYALKYVDPAELDRQREAFFSVPGKPREYTIIGSTIEVAPEPDDEYEVEIVYYTRGVVALSGTNPSNWLLEKHPDAYLYGALLHSAPYLHDDERAATWLNAYRGVMAGIVSEHDKMRFPAKLNRQVQVLS